MMIIYSAECGQISASIGRGFERLGMKPELITYGATPTLPLPLRVFRRVTDPGHERAIAASFNQTLRARVLPQVRRGSPELLLILKGDWLDTDNLAALRSIPCPIVLWAFDSLSRWPGQAAVAELAVHRFYIDGADVREGDSRSSWLPLGYDDELYSPHEPRNIDVLFAGVIGSRYLRRRRGLLELARSEVARKYDCALIGTRGSRVLDMALRLGPHLRWIASRLPERELARHIGAARICVNIHQDDGGQPVNPLFFAIPGSGTCMVAEGRRYLNRWLDAGRDYVPFDDDQFIVTIEALLADEERRAGIARQGHATVFAGHTYVERARTILKRAGLERLMPFAPSDTFR